MESYDPPAEVQLHRNVHLTKNESEEERIIRKRKKQVDYRERLKKLKSDQRSILKQLRVEQGIDKDEPDEIGIQQKEELANNLNGLSQTLHQQMEAARLKFIEEKAKYDGIQVIIPPNCEELQPEPARNYYGMLLQEEEEVKAIQVEEEELKMVPEEEQKDFINEVELRAAAAEARKGKMKRVLELREKAKEMYSKRNIDERTGNRGIIGQVRQQLMRPREEVLDEINGKRPVFKNHVDLDNQTDSEVLKLYKEQMIAIRNFILFDEKLPEDTVDSKDLIDKQKYIRSRLGLNKPEFYERNLNKAFKIIDILNMQTLFLYDPEYESYSVLTGKKAPTDSTGNDIFSYFKTESRECVNCAEEFNKGDILMKLSVCGHAFHADCAEEYMYYSNQCPLCRSNLYQN
ncbi:unnamed protein product [Moneuplotes crassus]|uniref:RING-type domain-containing protein n=1 Tax=Euplotes crassus TaxID=5936 RepID=A0AAD1UAN0_EUPCR|nr:unnamed protein product [Moneuplotes crassus]